MPKVFPQVPDIEFLNKQTIGNMGEILGIKFTNAGEDFLEASMPVWQNTKQPFCIGLSCCF
jgi:1,4-dihydroxy-2-naphthoyl-CoA hydrolase